MDHSRFTASHTQQDNIGWHAPPKKMLFFGNVPRAEVMRLRENISDLEAVKTKLRNGEAPGFRAPVGDEDTQLFEIRDLGDDCLTPHSSRSAVEVVEGNLIVQTKLITQIRKLSTAMEWDADEQEWYFKE